MVLHCISCDDEFSVRDGEDIDFKSCPACGEFGTLIEVDSDQEFFLDEE